jgi:hypothetical protein
MMRTGVPALRPEHRIKPGAAQSQWAAHRQAGALEPPAAPQRVDQGGGPRVGAVVDGDFEEFPAVPGDRGDGHAVVVGARVVVTGPLGAVEDPGLVEVQDHAAAPGCS